MGKDFRSCNNMLGLYILPMKQTPIPGKHHGLQCYTSDNLLLFVFHIYYRKIQKIQGRIQVHR